MLLIEYHMKVVMGICNRLAVLDGGQMIACGPPEQVRSDPRVIGAYLGRSAKIWLLMAVLILIAAETVFILRGRGHLSLLRGRQVRMEEAIELSDRGGAPVPPGKA